MSPRLAPYRRALRFAAAVVVGCFALVLVVSAPQTAPATASVAGHDVAACPPEAGDCSQLSFPCPAGNCSVALAPVSNLGTTQAVYVTVNGLPVGDDLGLGFCSLSQGNQPVASPVCSSNIPAPDGCQLAPPQSGNCPPTTTPSQWAYARVLSDSTNFTISTDFDPAGQGAKPIVGDPLASPSDYTSFNCDNGPANPCGLYVMDIPPGDYNGPGVPPVLNSNVFVPSPQNSVVVPLTWAPSASGCPSNSSMLVNTGYSMQQFLLAAGAATCNAPNGVAPIGTAIPSTDDTGCGTAGATFCPVQDVISGNKPVLFTDDPEDPGTQAELKTAGGKFAFIPIALSATEMAFLGGPGQSSGGGSAPFPFNNYDLTPAMAAGVLTQSWSSPIAQSTNPDDDVCGQLQLTKPCSQWVSTSVFKLNVETVNGSYADLNVFYGAPSPQRVDIPNYNFGGNFFKGNRPGTENYYAGQTGPALLNPWPLTVPGTNQALDEGQLGATFPETSSGTIYELTSWMCASSGQVPYSVGLPWAAGATANVHDDFSAQQLLTNTELGPIGINGGQEDSSVNSFTVQNPKKCVTLSKVPTNFAAVPTSNKSGGYQPALSPVTAAHTLQTFEINNSGGGFDFTSMDSSQATYYGLYPAALQNASGQFVLPSQASVDAAVSDANTNADGTLSPNFGTSDANAYPLPMVSYALVSTGPQPTDKATQLKNLLTNMVNYAHTSGAGTSNPLPAGYYPLPDNMYQQALADISKDINGSGASSSSGSGAGSTGSGLLANGAAPAGVHPGPLGLLSAIARGAGTGGAGSAVGTASGTSGGVVGRLISVSVGPERYFVPLLLLLALLCLVGGPLLYMYPNWRRVRSPSQGQDGELAAEGPTPGDDGSGGDP